MGTASNADRSMARWESKKVSSSCVLGCIFSVARFDSQNCSIRRCAAESLFGGHIDQSVWSLPHVSESSDQLGQQRFTRLRLRGLIEADAYERLSVQCSDE